MSRWATTAPSAIAATCRLGAVSGAAVELDQSSPVHLPDAARQQAVTAWNNMEVGECELRHRSAATDS